MSKSLALKLRDDVFVEADRYARKLKKPRNAYINEAVRFFNRLQRRRDLARIYAREARLGREDSLEALGVFEAMGDELPE